MVVFLFCLVLFFRTLTGFESAFIIILLFCLDLGQVCTFRIVLLGVQKGQFIYQWVSLLLVTVKPQKYEIRLKEGDFSIKNAHRIPLVSYLLHSNFVCVFKILSTSAKLKIKRLSWLPHGVLWWETCRYPHSLFSMQFPALCKDIAPALPLAPGRHLQGEE